MTPPVDTYKQHRTVPCVQIRNRPVARRSNPTRQSLKVTLKGDNSKTFHVFSDPWIYAGAPVVVSHENGRGSFLTRPITTPTI